VTRYNLAGASAGAALPLLSTGPMSREVLDARLALGEGLSVLRTYLSGIALGAALRGEGGTSSRTRNRPHVNDVPIRHVPGGNTKPVGGRLAIPARPVPVPAPELGGDTEPLPRPAAAGATGLIEPVRGETSTRTDPTRPTRRPPCGRWSSAPRPARPRRSG
jgi:hypothetical protein